MAEDPFADLGETLEGESAARTESGGATTGDGTADGGDERDPTTDSAFPYEAAEQRPFYAREATIETFDSWLKYELERELDERGYRNVVVREMTDALLRTVVEEDLIDEVGDRFERARAEAASESTE